MIEYRGYEFKEWFSGTMRDCQYKKMIDLLEQRKPKRICEVGCGTSTFIFEHYCEKYNAHLESIEHESKYLRKNGTLLRVDEYVEYKIEDEYFFPCNHYKGFTKWLQNQEPFDFVLIDGPCTHGLRERKYEYGRVQCVAFPILNKLTDNSILIMHDSERKQEANTLIRLEDVFKRYNYNFIREQVNDEGKTKLSMATYYLTKNIQK